MTNLSKTEFLAQRYTGRVRQRNTANDTMNRFIFQFFKQFFFEFRTYSHANIT